MARVIIAGGRDFDDDVLLEKKCNHLLKHLTNIEVVCGKCSGADSFR